MALWIPNSIRERYQLAGIKARARDIRHEFYELNTATDGETACDKAITLIGQLSQETDEWLTKGIDPNVLGAALEPAWRAALDALAAIEAHLKAHPNPERERIFREIKRVLEDPNLKHNAIVRLS